MSQTHADSENKLVLRYWNCAGRGMLMRYMAYDADLDFIDDLVDIDEDFLGGTCQTSKNDGNSPEHVKIQELCSVETIRPISVRKRSYGGENPRARVR